MKNKYWIILFISLIILFFLITQSLINVKNDFYDFYDYADKQFIVNSDFYQDIISKKYFSEKETFNYGNEYQELFINSINNKHRILIWEINGYNKINLNNIEESKLVNLDSIICKPVYKYFDYGIEELQVYNQLKKFSADQIKFALTENSKIISKDIGQNYIHYNISLSGLAISDKKGNYHFKIFFKDLVKDSDIVFLKKDNKFYFVLFYSINKMKKTENIMKYLKT